jgi:N-acetylneuraminic acid mutarotase
MHYRVKKRSALHAIAMATMLLPNVSKLQGQLIEGPWVEQASVPTNTFSDGTRSLGAAGLDGEIYTVGGLYWPEAVATVLRYSPSSDAWAQAASLPTARYAPAAASLEGRLYSLSGYSSSFDGASYSYDPNANAWSPIASMSVPRFAHQAVSLNGRIYSMGGQVADNSNTDTMEVYDPLTDTWSYKANMPSGRISFTAQAVNGKIYVLGGRVDNTYLPNVWEYDPTLDLWNVKTSLMPTPRETLASVVVGGEIFTLGGSAPGVGGLATIELYSPVTDTWRTNAPLPIARNECYAVPHSGSVYVFGGDGQSSMQSAVLVVPEPSTSALLLITATATLWHLRRRR